MSEKTSGFLKSMFLSIVISCAVMLILSVIFLALSNDLSGWDSLFSMFKIMYLFFGVPFLIFPVIDFFWPQVDDSFYIAVGIYYGGAFLGNFFGLSAGFIISSLLGYLYIIKIGIKK